MERLRESFAGGTGLTLLRQISRIHSLITEYRITLAGQLVSLFHQDSVRVCMAPVASAVLELPTFADLPLRRGSALDAT